MCSSDLTNDQLKAMADAPEFTCVVADEQTAGRGRRDRTWHSAPGEGLYLSVLLRPRDPVSWKIPLLSLMAGVTVAETLLDLGAEADIKWPNDVLLRGRKVCGILVEGVASGGETRVILGIGVNLNHASFPGELQATATSLRIELGRAVDGEGVRDRLLARIAHWYDLWRREDPRWVLDRWEQLSSTAHGQRVLVSLDGEQFAGVTEGLTNEGALQLRTDDGKIGRAHV